MATEPTDEDFFDAPTAVSLTKISIVEKYFVKWASVMARNQDKWRLRGPARFAYVDLYSGPGVYSDGTPSTPIRILNAALRIDKPSEELEFLKYFRAHFNDARIDRIDFLKSKIDEHFPKGEFRPGQIRTTTIALGKQLSDIYGLLADVPTLSFIDPFGIKGMRQELITKLISGRGCDCIFFFNYKKFNKYILADHYRPHMDGFFGESLANQLRENFADGRASVGKRELAIVAAVKQALGAMNALPAQEFKFFDDDGSRTSHFLFMATKSSLAEKFWKEVMRAESQSTQQGVPRFEFSPRPDASRSDTAQPQLSYRDGPRDILEDRIVSEFADAGTVRAGEMARKLMRGTPYLERNVKEALLNLERSGRVAIVRPSNRRPGSPIGDDSIVTIVKK